MKVLSPSSAIAIASLSVCVQGHGYISQPKASYEPNTIYTNYNALTTASINAGFNGGKYDGSPTDNAKVFNDHWNATGYKSLREMVDPIAPDYGKSIQTAAPIDVAGYTEMWWQNDEYKEGFIASHSVTVTEAPEATTTPTVTIATPEATKGATATAAPTAPDNCHMY
ncbi:hypothetical protein PRIC2_013679 [Phytophthora ramorum]